jgi:hypothetical protein
MVKHRYPFARANGEVDTFRNNHVKGKAQCEEDFLLTEKEKEAAYLRIEQARWTITDRMVL